MAQFNKVTQNYRADGKSLYEVVMLSTTSGNPVDANNPLPVTLGSNNITISGNVTIADNIRVNNTVSQGVPIKNDNSGPLSVQVSGITAVSVSGTTTISGTVAISNFPAVTTISGVVNIGLMPEIEIKNDSGNPIPVSGTLSVTQSGVWSVQTYLNPTAVDAFGRARYSQPVTLFDSSHRYVENPYWSTSTTSGGSYAHQPYESAINLTVTTASGASVIRETRRVFSYQPGKSLLNYNSFAFAPPQTNLRQRVGMFGANNGIFLENDGVTNYLVIRSQLAAGSPTENRVPQSKWNVDTFLGSGPSQTTLDVTKANILWMDVEWLGVGDVRVGFVVNGKLYIAHQFHNANVNPTVYMTTSCLPLRFEIQNMGTTASGSTAKQICSSVISEGGYEKKVRRYHISTPSNATLTNTAGTYTPLISFRLNSNYLDAIILPQDYQTFSPDTANFEFVIIRGGTINATTWTTNGKIDYNTDATTISGGTQYANFYLAATNQAGGLANQTNEYNWDTQLTRDLTGTAEIVTLAGRTIGSSSKSSYASILYYDLT